MYREPIVMRRKLGLKSMVWTRRKKQTFNPVSYTHLRAHETITLIAYAVFCLKTPVRVEWAVGKTPSLIGEFIGETHRDLEHTQTHPLRKQHQKSPICLWVVEGATENQQRVEQAP